MKNRGLEAHFTLYLTLYQKYLAALIDNNPIIVKDLREGFANVVSNITNFRNAVSNIPNTFGLNLKKTSRKFMGVIHLVRLRIRG